MLICDFFPFVSMKVHVTSLIIEHTLKTVESMFLDPNNSYLGHNEHIIIYCNVNGYRMLPVRNLTARRHD